MTMKGVVLTGDRRVEMREFPVPSPGSREVVVRMKTSGLCGSDLHFYRQSKAQREGINIIAGHEPCGVVESVGKEVENVGEGDRVSVYHYRGCGYCVHCLAGNIMWCVQRRGYGWHENGSDADYILTDDRNCMLLPQELSFVDGAMIACGTGTAFSALKKLQASSRHTLVIFGQGPIGLNGLLLARALGVRVICVEPNTIRRKLSLKLGADEVIDPNDTDPVKAISKMTGGSGADLGFETSGARLAQHALIESLGYGGKAVVVGLGSKENSVNLSQIISRQVVVMGSFVMPRPLYDELAGFLVKHEVNLEAMVTHRFPIEKAKEAFQLFDSGDTGKAVFEWQ